MRYISHRPDQTPLMMRIRDLAAARTRYGYFRIYILLRREGWVVNHKLRIPTIPAAYSDLIPATIPM
ncbi:hypothetical protein S2M10_13520 [Sphingomonas sp. S2M10]|nr:hypothetical protein [Sphingomonas sp. S2M10]